MIEIAAAFGATVFTFGVPAAAFATQDTPGRHRFRAGRHVAPKGTPTPASAAPARYIGRCPVDTRPGTRGGAR